MVSSDYYSFITNPSPYSILARLTYRRLKNLKKKEVNIMQTIFDSKPTQKEKITFEELASQTSKILPKREELQVVDTSMFGMPYMSTMYGYGGYPDTTYMQVPHQQWDPNQYQWNPNQWGSGSNANEWSQFSKVQVVSFNSSPQYYHGQYYDPNCDPNTTIRWDHPGKENWDQINTNWNNDWKGHDDWKGNNWASNKIDPCKPNDWNAWQYKGYPTSDGPIYIYPRTA